MAKRYGVAAVDGPRLRHRSRRPHSAGQSVRPGSIVSYPYGFQSTAVKLYEARDLLRRGAKEIGVVIGASKLLSREFQQVQTELNQLVEACRGAAARLTVFSRPRSSPTSRRSSRARAVSALKSISCPPLADTPSPTWSGRTPPGRVPG